MNKLSEFCALTALLALLAGSAAAGSVSDLIGDMKDKGRVGGPDTTLPALQAYAAAKTKCPSLLKLDQDTARLDADTLALSDRLDKTSKRLDQLAKRLAIPGQLAKVLAAIETQMVTAQKGAKMAEGVPQLAEKAKRFGASLTPALANVKAARAKADAIAKRLEPVRKNAEKFSGYAAKTALGLDGFSAGVLRHEPDVTYCIQFAIAYNDDPVKACVQQKADDLAAKLDPIVVELDKVIAPLLTTLDMKAPALAALDGFDANITPVEDLKKKAEALQKKLKAMCDALQALEEKMESSFTVSIPYLVGSYDIKVSMAIILKGSAAIGDYIKEKVSGAVWTAAKAFGLGKIVEILTDKANKAVNAIMDKVDFKMDLSLPLDPLNNLESRLPALEAAFPGSFSMPQLDTSLPSFGLPGVPAGLDLRQLALSLKEVSPGCASGNTRHLTGFTYGCAK